MNNIQREQIIQEIIVLFNEYKVNNHRAFALDAAFHKITSNYNLTDTDKIILLHTIKRKMKPLPRMTKDEGVVIARKRLDKLKE